MIHPQQQPDPGKGNDHAGSAVAHQRERQALRRKHAHVDADVDERLNADPQSEAGGQIALKPEARLGGKPRDVETAPDECDKQRKSQCDAGQPQLFRQHGEQEVRVRFRQIEELLDALSEADTEPLPAADRDERLRELKTAVVRIIPGMQKGRDAAQAIAGGHGEECKPRCRDRRHRYHVPQTGTREEQHSEAGGEQDGGSAQIRLCQEQRADEA